MVITQLYQFVLIFTAFAFGCSRFFHAALSTFAALLFHQAYTQQLAHAIVHVQSSAGRNAQVQNS
jgi:hypothetical protein